MSVNPHRIALSRRVRFGAATALALGVLVPGLGGCAAGETAWTEQPGSRVFAAQSQRELAAQRSTPPARLAWYANRRDIEPAVVVGPRAPVLERSVRVTIDRQRTIRGQVRDHHRTTIHRSELRRGLR